VLVAYGSKMGGTAGIAETIAAVLRERGHDVVLSPPDRFGKDVDGAVIGSALYAGRWRRQAVRALKVIASSPPPHVWLFHSGPIGEDADEPQRPPKEVAALAEKAGAADVVTFGGRLEEPSARGFLAKAMIRNGRGGDFRDMDNVAAWAATIADTLEQ
jgi:menaquinone-dependent protoporphyrinogen oxidase